MSFEEFAGIAESGVIKSSGEWNLAGQDGLTYWTTEPASAAHYANGFAPMHRRPTFERPAYVVATPRPEEVTHVPGTGQHEVGVSRAVATDEVVSVWRGRVYDFDPGAILIVERNGEWRTGGMVQPSARVVWEKLDKLEMELALGLSAPRPGHSRN
jgi:hypothetical protein